MYKSTLLVFALLVGIALAGGQYYVPRAYYTIDSAGHESLPVPLRRLRRAIEPSFYPGFRLPSSSSVDSGDGHGEFTVPAGLYSALRRRE